MTALVTTDGAEGATEVGTDNPPVLGGLESERGVERECIREESQGESEEASVGTRDATQEAETPIIHMNLEPDVGAVLPGYHITEADCCLDGIYGDHVHDNDGIHLDGGIEDDVTWQRR